ncbi:MAG: hypothetical protein ACKVPX_00185 [Myxococcaceae bacterium]
MSDPIVSFTRAFARLMLYAENAKRSTLAEPSSKNLTLRSIAHWAKPVDALYASVRDELLPSIRNAVETLRDQNGMDAQRIMDARTAPDVEDLWVSAEMSRARAAQALTQAIVGGVMEGRVSPLALARVAPQDSFAGLKVEGQDLLDWNARGALRKFMFGPPEGHEALREAVNRRLKDAGNPNEVARFETRFEDEHLHLDGYLVTQPKRGG